MFGMTLGSDQVKWQKKLFDTISPKFKFVDGMNFVSSKEWNDLKNDSQKFWSVSPPDNENLLP